MVKASIGYYCTSDAWDLQTQIVARKERKLHQSGHIQEQIRKELRRPQPPVIAGDGVGLSQLIPQVDF